MMIRTGCHFTPAAGLALLLTTTPLMAGPVEHINQQSLNHMIEQGDQERAFTTAFEVGDELFEHEYTAAEGIGANVGNGQRFSLVPRADLDQPGQWAAHLPRRVTGPNARSCTVCHGSPFGDGAGGVVLNNVRDPEHSGDPARFINRQTPHLFGIGALQLLAEEMTTELHRQRAVALARARVMDKTITVPLATKGVSYGQLSIAPDGQIDSSLLQGIDADLIVRPIEWKGITTSIRAFVRDASHNELGLQATEITGDGVDGDGDGVRNELSVGDITAMVVYQAAQPRPVTRLELAERGLIEPLAAREKQQIRQGEQLFMTSGCSGCHTPAMRLDNPVFSEPSRHALYRDERFPAGTLPADAGLSLKQAITFDLTRDLPDNRLAAVDGSPVAFGNFERDEQGGAVVRLYGDLKRHDMGPQLAEPVDEAGRGASTFLTKELWGVGSTAPYLHDGRATTLHEAILLHGGESQSSRDNYAGLAVHQQQALISWLNNLVLYKMEES